MCGASRTAQAPEAELRSLWVHRRVPPAVAAAAAAAALLLPAGGAAAARSPLRIDTAGIGPLTIGARTLPDALGTPQRTRAGSSERAAWADRGLAALLGTSGQVVGIVAWSSRWTTAAGIGPCSSERILRTRLGRQLQTVVTGSGVRALRAGSLVFALDDSGYVRAVLVAPRGGPVSALAALQAPACGKPSV